MGVLIIEAKCVYCQDMFKYSAGNLSIAFEFIYGTMHRGMCAQCIKTPDNIALLNSVSVEAIQVGESLLKQAQSLIRQRP